MSSERTIATFVTDTKLQQIPAEAKRVAQHILLTVLGTAIAGAREAGVQESLTVYGDTLPAGSGATVLVHGNRLPPANAAAVNGLMCRALDYCDAMAPGLHIGSSLVPAAFAAAELRGGCTGAEFLEALVMGAEVGSRMNLDEGSYAGLDPTGVAGVFASTAAAARILKLTSHQTLHALSLAFNRCGGSLQSNIDGSLAVRMIQGWVAADGVTCARLAQAGITGPLRMIGGVYGYGALYAKSSTFAERVVAGLGEDYQLLKTMFKKYPSCGLTQGVTELALQFVRNKGLRAIDIDHITVRLPPYAYRLVGHDFAIGENPRVNAQFSAQYCVANAFLRQGSTLDHFRASQIAAVQESGLIPRIKIESVPAMTTLDHTAVELIVHDQSGQTHQALLEIAPGFPGNPLSEQEQVERFEACLSYANMDWATARKREISNCVFSIQELRDARHLIRLCTVG